MLRAKLGLLTLSLSLSLGLSSTALHAQFAGTAARDDFRDTTILRPPAGSKVAILVFEDLGCPACARAHPIEEKVAAETHVPLLRYDFPLAAHVWTFGGAVDARYIQDKISPKLAAEFRDAVFLNQMSISSKEDIDAYTRRWLTQHGHTMPANVDPEGKLAAEVRADYDLGQRLNVQFTPTLVVVTRNNYQVVCGTREGANNPNDLLAVVQGALAQTSGANPHPVSAPRGK